MGNGTFKNGAPVVNIHGVDSIFSRLRRNSTATISIPNDCLSKKNNLELSWEGKSFGSASCQEKVTIQRKWYRSRTPKNRFLMVIISLKLGLFINVNQNSHRMKGEKKPNPSNLFINLNRYWKFFFDGKARQTVQCIYTVPYAKKGPVTGYPGKIIKRSICTTDTTWVSRKETPPPQPSDPTYRLKRQFQEIS